MRYEINFSDNALAVLAKWKKSNPILFKKAYKIINDIAEHPRSGLGHPEALKGGNSTLYSRRVTAHDRIVYDIYDEHIEVQVISVQGHYSDK
ncbi:MAG: Txe/YoeB family addiction module toxin [Bacteroidaceae bacterium]|nr:Txe/YoeB family addiction module toxin [Bacteroidaceae bacterium]